MRRLIVNIKKQLKSIEINIRELIQNTVLGVDFGNLDAKLVR